MHAARARDLARRSGDERARAPGRRQSCSKRCTEITLQELLRLSCRRSTWLTGEGFVTASSQNARLLELVPGPGLSTPPDAGARDAVGVRLARLNSTISRLKCAGRAPAACRSRARTSTAKLLALQNYASTDGYARNLIQYWRGGFFRTLRWGGRGPQIQNFPRPVIQASNIPPAIDMILHDLDTATDTLRMLYGNPLDVISSCLRGVFRTPIFQNWRALKNRLRLQSPSRPKSFWRG